MAGNERKSCGHEWVSIKRFADKPPLRVCHYCKADVGEQPHDLVVSIPGIIAKLRQHHHLIPDDGIQYLYSLRHRFKELNWFEIERIGEIYGQLESQRRKGRA